MKIMVVEDNIEINKILSKMLIKEGYEVSSYHNAFDALEAFKKENFFCILTDLMMPILTGEELIKQIRTDYYGLIMAITAKTSIEDKLRVLELGADDYIMKPFNKKEILLKVNNYASKIQRSNHKTSLNNKEFIFNYHDTQLEINGTIIPLTSVEFLVLKVFIQSLNKIISREEIMDQVYYDETEVFDRAVDGHIKNIRKKIKKHTDTEYIKTVYGMGYKMVGVLDE